MQVDSDCDDSDYVPEEDEAIDESIDCEVADHRIDTILVKRETQESTRIAIQDVPIPEDFCADPCQISVAELEEEIRFQIRKGNLKDTLTKIDVTSKLFSNPQYLPREIQLGKDRYPPRETRYQVIQKTYGSPLHYACHDQNGSRGEHKIRLLLCVANQYKIPIHKLLTLSEVTVRKYGTEWHKITVEAGTERMQETRATPLYILLDNPNSSASTVRRLSEPWPSIVHLQYFTNLNVLECHNTLSHFLLKNPISPYEHSERDIARIASIVQVLLQVAAKTDLDAKSLVTVNTHFGRDDREADQNSTIITRNAVQIALSHGGCVPPKVLASMLQVWPEAVQYPENDYSSKAPCPLCCIVDSNPKTTKARLWQTKCIEVILKHSSLESFAMGLMRTNNDGSLQFHNVMRIISKLKSSSTETGLATDLLEAMKALLYQRDEQGKALLHHVVAAPIFRSPKRECKAGNAHFKRRKCLLPPRANHHVDLVRWILEEEPSLAWVHDKGGHNALHTALEGGSTWFSGVRDMLEIVPDWQYEAIKVDGKEEDLLPFQIAATAVGGNHGAVDTVYELLKITGPLAFSHFEFH
ncbi:unnamed protein product [Cylindrotheca closterium]|uniref:Uncharacterized protein n=1 Tax=Cylindrotheca closterium TaxID=2856 RepID=A0AAD2JIX9_9STRA|nr:unnamed protein product [Cylindrotheca closterium]